MEHHEDVGAELTSQTHIEILGLCTKFYGIVDIIQSPHIVIELVIFIGTAEKHFGITRVLVKKFLISPHQGLGHGVVSPALRSGTEHGREKQDDKTNFLHIAEM